MTQTALTIEEVAKRLHLQPTTIRCYLRDGRIPGVKFGRVWRIPEGVVDDLLAGRLSVNGNGKHGAERAGPGAGA